MATDLQGPDDGTVEEPLLLDEDSAEAGWLADDNVLADGTVPPHMDQWGEDTEDGDAEDDQAAEDAELEAEDDTDEDDTGDDAQPETAPQTKPVKPDNVDIAAMTDAEYAAWATANPAAARRMSLRWTDYSNKNAERNRQQEQLERDREAFEQQVQEFERLRTAPGAAPESPSAPGQQPDTDSTMTPAEMQQVYNDLHTRLGRQPTDVEFMSAAVSFEVGRRVKSLVQPVQQTVEEQQRALQADAYQKMVARINAEYEALVAERPEASSPQVQQAIADFCRDHNLGSQEGDIAKAFYALYGRDVVNAGQRGRTRARQQQAAAAQAAPMLGPGSTGAPPAAPRTTDLNEIARRQQQRVMSGEI